MRWICISLVLANIALAAWYWVAGGGRVAPEAVTRAPMAVADQSLRLLSEVANEGVSQLIPEQRLRMPVGEVEEGGAVCSMVGPFKALLPAEYFVEHLQALEVQAEVERLEVPSGAGYWVYQAPQSSRKEALRRLHELQAAGLDSYVIPKGELENGVSFGFFSNRAGAQARLAEVSERGYDVLLKEVARSYEEIWVVLASLESAKVGDELWLTLLNREEGLEIRQNFCPGVAHGEKFI